MAILNSLSLLSSSPFSPKSHHSSPPLSSFPFTLFFKPNTARTQSLNLRSRNHAVSSTFTGIEVGEDLPLDYGDCRPKPDPNQRRRAGILLHPTSFRGPYGIGDLGEEAFRLIDWLHLAGKPDPNQRRRAGILLHPTSFRGPYGIGDLGEEAFRFIDWLHLAGCSVGQVLPLVPPDEEGSPYAGQDANCGNAFLISLEELVKDGLRTKEELPQPIDSDLVNYSIVANLRIL
ncbi:hypothetical protein CRYUN_Cryun15aG0084200 [Craigia yunnanensis]